MPGDLMARANSLVCKLASRLGCWLARKDGRSIKWHGQSPGTNDAGVLGLENTHYLMHAQRGVRC